MRAESSERDRREVRGEMTQMRERERELRAES